MKQLLHQFFFDTSLNDNKVLNAGWLLFRLHIGLSIAMHAGWPKMNTISVSLQVAFVLRWGFLPDSLLCNWSFSFM